MQQNCLAEQLCLKTYHFYFLLAVRALMERMGKTLFFRSGDHPLILSEDERDRRKEGLLLRLCYTIPTIEHIKKPHDRTSQQQFRCLQRV